ncbi:hypothetical protein PPERSA_07595 [Pseudocohnilembus persalinus]|uniref:Cytidyltransferase-like domain-containing protein n=1 Tax=Pseudocohnilembus persalinus TaxID=266149 RepID=A0A0V0QIA2_PSEPJ|nr:hypothetical protein PPERSA_07595 [Pseudocohnilembus persalinus]|eukprot:KRX01950.1 hypothetical protein PPERSA_07595 [Pseudocohnilembus persalinus]
MNKVVENSLLILDLDSYNIQNQLALAYQVAENSQFSLCIEFISNQQELSIKNSQYYYIKQLIFTSLINDLKIKTNPQFDFNIIYPQIFKIESLITSFKERIQIPQQKPHFSFGTVIIEKSLEKNQLLQKVEQKVDNNVVFEDLHETEIGEKVKDFCKSKNFAEKINQLNSDLQILNPDNENDIGILSKKRVGLGGTFDYLHSGHKLLLSKALYIAQTMVIGITTDSMLQKKQQKEYIQNIHKRIFDTKNYVFLVKGDKNQEVIPLQDPAGPAGEGQLDALVITPETVSGGEYVNNVRKEKNLETAPFVIIDLIGNDSENINKINEKISSTAIRTLLQNDPTIDIQYLKEQWNLLVEDSQYAQRWFWEIVNYYQQYQRYYHTLKHIQTLLKEKEIIKDKLKDEKVVSFAIFFHDIIYNPRDKYNEEKSAQLFENFYNNYEGKKPISSQQFQKIYDYIVFTKNHTIVKSDDNDLNLFLDLDLSILGQQQGTYLEYSQQILLEYEHYSQKELFQGRAQVLEIFLKEEKLFKTEYFQNIYESVARQNIKQEIQNLKQMAEKL